jgi:hypothetical protein
LARPEGPVNSATHCLAPHLETALRAISDLSPRKSGERLRKSATRYKLTPRRWGNCRS